MIQPAPIHRPGCRRGFSLVELLVVMSIMVVLGAMVVPAAGGLMQGYQLTAAANNVTATLMLARETALIKGAPVEVRFYKLPGHGAAGGSPEVFRAMQCFVEENTATSTPLTKPIFFAQPVQVLDDAARSTLLSLPASGPDVNLGGYAKNYQYVSFRFKPNGQSDLAETANCLTLVLQQDAAADTTPANFRTIQIASPSGRVQTYQP